MSEEMEKREAALRDREKTLLALDKVIAAYARKYNLVLPIPENDERHWAGIHQAITGIWGFPIVARLQSKRWLNEHGYPSGDGGKLDLLLTLVLAMEAEDDAAQQKEREQNKEEGGE